MSDQFASPTTLVMLRENPARPCASFLESRLAAQGATAVAAWEPAIDGARLRGSAPGILVHPQEILAQLLLGNVLDRAAVLIAQDALDQFGRPDGIGGDFDEHWLWLSLARLGRLSMVIAPGAQREMEHADPPSRTARRLDFVRRYWAEDPDAVLTIERTLALYPFDEELWSAYQAGLRDRWPADSLPDDRRFAALCLRGLRPGPDQVQALNELAGHFACHGQPFLSALCRISSLAQDPTQAQVYAALEGAWQSGVFDPAMPGLDPQDACKVTVILCTYNRPQQLRRALASVLAQTFEDYEVLVINDGGDEEAARVVAEANSPRVRYFTHAHGGHRVSLNHGLRAARGKYVAYLDDDDIFYPNHLEALVTKAENEGLQFVSSRTRWSQGHWRGDEWHEDWDLTQSGEDMSTARLHVSPIVTVDSVLHRRSLVNRVGLFWEEPPRGGDWEYWVRCSHYCTICRLDEVTGEARVLTASLPMGQPARARLMTALWCNYFGSASGHAVMAVAAALHGDMETSRWHLDRIVGAWEYLSSASCDLLWSLAKRSGGNVATDVVSRLAAAQPLWVGLRLLREAKQGRLLDRTELTVLPRLTGYALRTPGVAGKVVRKMLRRREKRTTWM